MRQGALILGALALGAACVELRGAEDEGGESEVGPGRADAGGGDGAVTLPGADEDAAAPLAVAEQDLEWAMWRVPAPSPANTDYTVTAGTVRDERTRLVWQRAASAPASFADARAACEALELEGETDWRLPTRIELLSILDYGRASPALNPTAFPPATEGGSNWSASADARAPSARAWCVDFAGRASAVIEVQSKLRVRCVRGLAEPKPAASLEGEVVLDPRTGLRWQRRVATPAPVTWTEALLACQSARTEGRLGWRLPSARELESLYDVRAVSGPAWRTSVFPADEMGLALPSRVTWSSTEALAAASQAVVVVDFTPEHATATLGPEATALVRCVLGP